MLSGNGQNATDNEIIQANKILEKTKRKCNSWIQSQGQYQELQNNRIQ